MKAAYEAFGGTRIVLTAASATLTISDDATGLSAGLSTREAIASAYAPNGLVAATQLKASFAGSVGHGLMAAASFVGVAAAGALDTAAANSQNGVAGWSCTLTTANPSDLLLGWSGINANSTSTPAAPSTELHDFGSSTFFEWATSVYQVTTGAGAKALGGTWAHTSGATSNLTLCAAYRAG